MKAPKTDDKRAHKRTYCELRRDTQLVLATMVSTVVLGLINRFILKADGVGLSGAFVLSMVPALYNRSVQIRYDWETQNHKWEMKVTDQTSMPIYPYDIRH